MARRSVVYRLAPCSLPLSPPNKLTGSEEASARQAGGGFLRTPYWARAERGAGRWERGARRLKAERGVINPENSSCTSKTVLPRIARIGPDSPRRELPLQFYDLRVLRALCDRKDIPPSALSLPRLAVSLLAPCSLLPSPISAFRGESSAFRAAASNSPGPKPRGHFSQLGEELLVPRSGGRGPLGDEWCRGKAVQSEGLDTRGQGCRRQIKIQAHADAMGDELPQQYR